MKTINTILTIAAVVFATQASKADGFKCQTIDGDLNLKVYNHTQAEAGTRTAAVMVLSNPDIGSGNKTIAKFTDVNSTLASASQTYVAKVDLRFNDSSRKGELVLGTKLGYVDMFILTVDFSYAQPTESGAEVTGWLTVVKRDGEQIDAEVSCTRYLKN